MKPFRRFVLACRGFAIYGTAHADLLFTCVASVPVQTLVACLCRSAYAVAWRRRLPPYLESPPVYDRPKSFTDRGPCLPVELVVRGTRHSTTELMLTRGWILYILRPVNNLS